MRDEYIYRVTEVVRVVDGDTYWVRVDVGFRHTALVNVRLYGYDTPETNVEDRRERESAKQATDVAAQWLTDAVTTNAADGGVLWIRTEKDPDSFGRWLAVAWVEYPSGESQDLGTALHTNGLASRWPTRWRDEFLT